VSPSCWLTLPWETNRSLPVETGHWIRCIGPLTLRICVASAVYSLQLCPSGRTTLNSLGCDLISVRWHHSARLLYLLQRDTPPCLNFLQGFRDSSPRTRSGHLTWEVSHLRCDVPTSRFFSYISSNNRSREVIPFELSPTDGPVYFLLVEHLWSYLPGEHRPMWHLCGRQCGFTVSPRRRPRYPPHRASEQILRWAWTNLINSIVFVVQRHRLPGLFTSGIEKYHCRAITKHHCWS
jgi:hypothetical protein